MPRKNLINKLKSVHPLPSVGKTINKNKRLYGDINTLKKENEALKKVLQENKVLKKALQLTGRAVATLSEMYTSPPQDPLYDQQDLLNKAKIEMKQNYVGMFLFRIWETKNSINSHMEELKDLYLEFPQEEPDEEKRKEYEDVLNEKKNEIHEQEVWMKVTIEKYFESADNYHNWWMDRFATNHHDDYESEIESDYEESADSAEYD